jgi:hypothetical protein
MSVFVCAVCERMCLLSNIDLKEIDHSAGCLRAFAFGVNKLHWSWTAPPHNTENPPPLLEEREKECPLSKISPLPQWTERWGIRDLRRIVATESGGRGHDQWMAGFSATSSTV